LVFKLTRTHEDSQFSPPQMALRNLIHVFWIFVSCLWSDQSEYMALMAFNLWIGPGFIFESCS